MVKEYFQSPHAYIDEGGRLRCNVNALFSEQVIRFADSRNSAGYKYPPRPDAVFNTSFETFYSQPLRPNPDEEATLP